MLQKFDMDDIYEKESIEQRINEEEYNINHLPEDDDFGDMDGDEFFDYEFNNVMINKLYYFINFSIYNLLWIEI